MANRRAIASDNEMPMDEEDGQQQRLSSSSMSTLTPSDGQAEDPDELDEQQQSQNVKSLNPKNVRNNESESCSTQAPKTNNEVKTSSSSSTDEPPESEDVFEVEKIVGHKSEKGKDYWKVRWVGYGPNDDTWEPRENFLDEKVVKMLNEYEADRLAKKEMQKKSVRRSKAEQQEKTKPISDESNADVEEVEQNTSWFGITKDEGSREERGLFVQDRILSKTEKLLTEFGSTPGVRILRNHLRGQAGNRDGSQEKTESLTGTPTGKRKKTPRKTTAVRGSTDPSSSSEIPSQKAQNKMETAGSISSSKDVSKNFGMNSKNQQQDLKSDKEANNNEKKEEITKWEHRGEQKKELDPKTLKEVKSSEFGISKGLMPKKPQAKQKRKITVAEEKMAKRSKEEKKSAKEQKESAQKKREKSMKLPIISSKETGLPLPSLSEGSKMSSVFVPLIKKSQHDNSIEVQEKTVSQEAFEENVMDGKVGIVRTVLSDQTKSQLIDLNRVDELGKSLIHRLCEIKCGVSHTQCELITLLVSNGAQLHVRESNNDQIPLHIAISNRRLCHVRKLLELLSPVNSIDKNGKSPLILALDCSDFEFMKCLLKAGASFQPSLEKLYKDKDKNKRQLRFLSEHETQLRKVLNSARDNVTANMGIKCISPIFVNPLHDKNSVHTFHLSTQPQLPIGDYAYLLFVSVAEFIPDDREKELCCSVDARMWGQSPVKNVILNGRTCQQLKAGNKFAFVCIPCQGQNQLEMTYEPEARDLKMVLLSQVVLAQMFRPSSQSRPIAFVQPIIVPTVR